MTIYDISEKAGVSIATVSRVLNGSNNVSEKTKKKVLDVINQYEYTPNAFARGLGLNTMKTIGIMCVPTVRIRTLPKRSTILSRSFGPTVTTASCAVPVMIWIPKQVP